MEPTPAATKSAAPSPAPTPLLGSTCYGVRVRGFNTGCKGVGWITEMPHFVDIAALDATGNNLLLPSAGGTSDADSIHDDCGCTADGVGTCCIQTPENTVAGACGEACGAWGGEGGG